MPAARNYNTDYGLWRCEGNRCESNTLNLRDFYVACSPLAQSAGRIVSFRSRELLLNASELERCNSPIVTEFYVYVCSGRDDLRQGSVLKMSWQVAGRRFVASEGGQPLFTHIPRGDCQTARLRRPLLAAFPLSDLLSLHFTFESGRRAHSDTPDNWDMRKLIVHVNTTRPGGAPLSTPLIDLEGRPVHRFSNVERWSVDVPRR